MGVPAPLRTARSLRPFAAALGRYVPYVGVAITAYELYQLFNDWLASRHRTNPGAWRFDAAANADVMQAGPKNVGYVLALTTSGTLNRVTRPGGYMIPQQGWPFPNTGNRYLSHRAVSELNPATPTIWTEAGITRYINANYPAVPRSGAAIAPHPLTNPNIQRRLPSTRPVEVPFRSPEMVPSSPPVRGEVSAEAPIFRRGEFNKYEASFGPRVSPRARPRPRVRERKNFSRSRKLAILLFRGLDAVSEYAELVDAFYEALPKDVQKRWNQKDRGLIDNAGQYGIDGADWKLEAIYHNYQKIDVEQVVENIIKNNVEDDIIGAINRARPRNSGHAFDPADKALGKELNEYLDDLVDFDKLW